MNSKFMILFGNNDNKETREEIKKYKSPFIDRYVFHIRTVQDNMILLENNLSKLDLNVGDFQLFERSFFHDIDKLQPDLIWNYFEFSKYFSKKKEGIDINFDKEKYIKKINKHYETQRHHFYKNDIIPNDVDICEMCCDISAVSIEKQEKDNIDYYKNIMLKEHKKLNKYNNKILKIFDLIWKLKDRQVYENVEKYNLINKILKNIRNLQDVLVFLEKNNDKLHFETSNYANKRENLEDYDLFRKAFVLDLKLIKNNDFPIENIDNLNQTDICVIAGKIFLKKNENCLENSVLSNYKNDINNILRFLNSKYKTN